MSASPTLVASPPRRHHLSPMKVRGVVASSPLRNSTLSTATKRPHADENAEPLAFLTSPSKRVKANLKSSLAAVLKQSSPIAARPQKRAFGVLGDVTNTRAHASPLQPSGKAAGVSGKGLGKAPRTILKVKKPSKNTSASTSPIRRRAPSPRVGSGRGTKRAASPVRYTRIDPPKSLSSSISSIDSLLASSSTTSRSVSTSISSLDGGVALIPETLAASNIPDSWNFDIYEDSPEETLQNLMEHSTHTLDISDDSDNESNTSELAEKGKENIPPARLAELLATTPSERASAMRVDTKDKAIPQRKAPGGGPGGRVLREHREALREMDESELAAPENDSPSASVDGSAKLPTLAKEDFFEFTPPKKGPATPGSPGWAIWESDHEGDKDEKEEDEKEPELPQEKEICPEMIALPEPDFDEFQDLSGICVPSSPTSVGASDKEN